MKYLAVVIVALAAVAAADWASIDAKFREKLHEDCYEQSQVSEKEIRKMFAKKHSDDKNLREYVLCVFKKANLFNDAAVEKDNFVNHFVFFDLDRDTATEIVNKCYDSNEQISSAEWAYRTLECMIANNLLELLDEGKKKANSRKSQKSKGA